MRVKSSHLHIMLVVFLLLGSIFVSSWIGLRNLEQQTREGIGESLRTVVETTHGSLLLWFEGKKSYPERCAEEPKLRELLQKRLEGKVSPEELNAHLESLEYRKYGEGLSLLSPQGQVLASRSRAEVGKRSAIFKERQERFSRALAGETVFVPPVMVANSSGHTHPRLFLLTPVKNLAGQTIAVLALQIDPAREFTRLHQLGRLGKSGETYAFDEHGWLLSDSRFPQQTEPLRNGESAILRLIDPGSREKSLTPLAVEAVDGKPGLNIDGYRDYRGIRVLGAWIWDRDLGLGLATEIDEREAMATYRDNREVVLGIVGLATLISLGLVGFVVQSGAQTVRFLEGARDDWEHLAAERNEELQKHSMAVQSSPVSVVITTTQGLIEYVNPQFTETTGYTPEEVVGKNPNILNAGKLPEEFYRELWETIRSGQVWRGDFCNRHKNGEIFWERASISPIFDEAGEITHFVSVKDNITEHRENELALKRREQELRQLVEVAPFALALLRYEDKGMPIEHLNQSFTDMFGYTLADTPDLATFSAKAYPDDEYREATLAEWMERNEQAGRKGTSVAALEARVCCKNGEKKTVGWAAVNVGSQQIVMAIDLTARKKAEQALIRARQAAEDATRAKSDFLANMSHELRTPLNAIIGFSEIMVDGLVGELTEQQTDYLQEIFGSGRYLLSLINDILDLSKLEAGKFETELSETDAKELCQNVVTIAGGQAARANLELVLDIDEAIQSFWVDERRLKQVLYNLLSNAVKFTPEGGTVTLKVRLKPEECISFQVEDTGVGISQEDLPKLFVPFQQLGDFSTRKTEGTGLGLALSKRFLKLMDGEISVESELGRGSTFEVTLPYRRDDAATESE